MFIQYLLLIKIINGVSATKKNKIKCICLKFKSEVEYKLLGVIFFWFSEFECIFNTEIYSFKITGLKSKTKPWKD